jgi:hypothetical protein
MGKRTLQFAPSDEQRREVMLLTGFRLKPDVIGLLIRHPMTGLPLGGEAVRRLFPHELLAGKAMVDAKVAESLYKKAIGNGNQAVTAAIFWMKANAGWAEKGEGAVDDRLPAGVLVVPAMVAPSEWIAEQTRKNAKRQAPASTAKAAAKTTAKK